jgi:hypothetical protein
VCKDCDSLFLGVFEVAMLTLTVIASCKLNLRLLSRAGVLQLAISHAVGACITRQ